MWAKGTILMPQHMQAQDRFLQSIFQFRVNALNFRPWGFSSLRLRHDLLAEGNVAVSHAAGIFPDGLAFECPDSDLLPPPRPIAPFFDGERQSLDVHIAIPLQREGGLNVSRGQQTADARYVVQALEIRDENTGADEKPIQFARKNFRILFEDESPEGSVSLKMARVRRTAAGTFEADPLFVPPLLDINGNDYLLSILRRLVEILAAKSDILSGRRRQKSQNLADFTSAEIANFWLLYSVNSYFPLVRHIQENRKGHPEVTFRLLLALAGALTTFSPKIQLRDLPEYSHDDLGSCFTDLDEKLRELLETVVPSNYISLPLKMVQPSIYATTLDDDKYLAATKMFLAVAADLGTADLIKRAPQLVKLGSASQIEHLVRQALPGIQISHLTRVPPAIPVRLNYEYFSLNQSGPVWDGVNRSRTFGAYVPGDIPNPKLELIILLPQAL
jgi:type VI secretion system protein ImpJ